MPTAPDTCIPCDSRTLRLTALLPVIFSRRKNLPHSAIRDIKSIDSGGVFANVTNEKVVAQVAEWGEQMQSGPFAVENIPGQKFGMQVVNPEAYLRRLVEKYEAEHSVCMAAAHFKYSVDARVHFAKGAPGWAACRACVYMRTNCLASAYIS